jgi:LacI family transcriptional regulator
MNNQSQVTMKDVAKALGISCSTVSLALHNDPRIRAERRTSVQETALRLGYHPDAMATALISRRWTSADRPISAELAWLNNWKRPARLRGFREFDLCWQGAQEAAESQGFRLEEFVVGGDLSFARLGRILHSRNIQGILIPPHGGEAGSQPKICSLDWRLYSVIRIGYSIPEFPANVVSGNHLQGTMLAFSEIWKRGYRRIGYVCHQNPSTRSRAGFLMMQADCLDVTPIPILELDVHAKNCRGTLGSWMHKNRPDAILTEIAQTATMLNELGVRIPDDVGLAATSVLDGNTDAGICQNSKDIGRAAADTLIGLIRSHQAGFPVQRREVLVEASWQDGEMLPVRSQNAGAEFRFGWTAFSQADQGRNSYE